MRDVILTSSVLILAILAVRTIVKGKVSAKLQYALWLLVAIRLMIPGTLGSSSISVLHLLQIPIKTESDSVSSSVADPNADADANVGLANVGSTMAGADAGISVYLSDNIPDNTHKNTDGNASDNMPMHADGNILGNEDAGADVNHEITADAHVSTDFPIASIVVTIIHGIWILGIVITGGCMLWYQIRFMRHLSARRKPLQGENVQYHGLKVYTVKGLPSPCLCGNKIYLNEEAAEDEAKLKHILAHEYCHYRQLDSLWAVVRCVLVSVYWFHPLVWAAAYISKQDSELACDEAAVALLGEEERYAYGRTLLSLVCEKVPKGTTIGPLLTMGSSEKGIRERIGRIAKRPKALALAGGLVLVFAAVIAVITFTGTRQDETGRVGLMMVDSDTGTTLAEADLTDKINDIEALEKEKNKILEELKQAQDAMAEQKKAEEQLLKEVERREEELRKMAEELAAEERVIAMQESATLIELLSHYDEILFPVKGEGREGEIRNLPGAIIRRPSDLGEEYFSRGEDAIIEGLYYLVGWNGREGQSMPQSVNDELEDIISVYGLYTKEYGLRGVKIVVGEGPDKDVNNFDIPWSFLGASRVHVFETAQEDKTPDGLPRTFAFKQLVPGSEETYMNYGREAYELYICDRYDTGHIELSKVSEGDLTSQIQDRISCKVNQEEQKVYVYDNGTVAGVVDTSEVSAANPYSIESADVDTGLIDFILGAKAEDTQLVTTVSLRMQTEEGEYVMWHHGIPALTFPVDCGYFGPDREFALGKAKVDTAYVVNTRFESARQ